MSNTEYYVEVWHNNDWVCVETHKFWDTAMRGFDSILLDISDKRIIKRVTKEYVVL
jgi:hypothetical protein